MKRFLVARNLYTNIIVIVILISLVIFSYSNTLTNFFLDDEYGFLITPFFSHHESISHFIIHRPAEFIPNVFAYFFWACIAKVFGSSPIYHHFAMILLHIMASYLLFVFVRGISGETLLGLCTALLFAVSYISAETVARVMHMQYVLCAIFFLVSLLCITYRKSWYFMFFALLSFILGLMCKEIILILPCVVLIYDYFFRNPLELSKRCKVYIILFSITIFYLIIKFSFPIRFGSMGSLWRGEVPYVIFFREHGLLKGMYLYGIKLITIPLKHIIISVNRFVFGPYTSIIKSILVAVNCLPIFVYLGLNPRKFLSDKVFWFGLIWVIINAVPFIHLLDSIDYNNGGLINTRYLYLSSMGFALMLGRSLQQLIIERRRWLKRISVTLFIAILLISMIILYGNNSAYQYAAEIAREIPLQTMKKFPLPNGGKQKYFFLCVKDELYYAKGVHLFKNGGLDGAFLLAYNYTPDIYIVDTKEYNERLQKYNTVPDNLLPKIDLSKATSEGYVLRWDKINRSVIEVNVEEENSY